MDRSQRRTLLFNSGFALLVVDLLLYAVALLRTPNIDPTSIEWFVYFYGGIGLNIVALIFACFGTGWRRITMSLVGLVIAYLWISYMGIEIMKH
jgi:hypothetical protein